MHERSESGMQANKRMPLLLCRALRSGARARPRSSFTVLHDGARPPLQAALRAKGKVLEARERRLAQAEAGLAARPLVQQQASNWSFQICHNVLLPSLVAWGQICRTSALATRQSSLGAQAVMV